MSESSLAGRTRPTSWPMPTWKIGGPPENAAVFSGVGASVDGGGVSGDKDEASVGSDIGCQRVDRVIARTEIDTGLIGRGSTRDGTTALEFPSQAAAWPL